MPDTLRKKRAEFRRERAVITRHRSGESAEDQFFISGLDAMLLAAELSEEGWSLSGQPFPDYNRSNTPYIFVKGFPE